MENQNQNTWEVPAYAPPPPFPAKGRELAAAGVLALLSICLCGCILFAGFNLGFAVCALGILACGWWYLARYGHRPSGYARALLLLSGVILASFPRGNDGFVKLVLVGFLFLAGNLGLGLAAGKNRYDSAGFLSLLDAPRIFFGLGFGTMGRSLRGLGQAKKQLSEKSRTGMAVLTGLILAVPVLAVLIPLLMSADAAFDGLLGLLPEFDLEELVSSVIFGCMVFPVLYARCIALVHAEAPAHTPTQRKYPHPATVLTVLAAVCAVYAVYLLSQLAYFVGGFSGILPGDYTLAQYARRGFFEMAALCGINLGIIALAVGLTRQPGRALRLLCLFTGLISVFLVVSASAKMGLYIASFGLTRLRVLTEVIMLFLGIATVLVCLWLFLPRLPYMKAVLLCALVMGAAVSWVDVDTAVAAYNVRAYQTGQLDTVDVEYLGTLSDGAIPWLHRLVQEADPDTAARARRQLENCGTGDSDLRAWNYTAARAEEILALYRVPEWAVGDLP